MAPQVLECFLVLDRQLLAQFDEVAAGDCDLVLARLLRWDEVRVVVQRRVAAHAEVVLYPALGGQSVVVPAHRVEDCLALHPLIASDAVCVGVAEHVTDVQRTAHRGRWRVDRVHLVARLRPIEDVGVLVVPDLRPLGLDAIERRLFWHARGCRVFRGHSAILGTRRSLDLSVPRLTP